MVESKLMSRGDANTNLKVLKPTRGPLRRGDIFILHPSGHGYLLGRVIKTNARIGPMDGGILIYLYRGETPTKPSTIPARLQADQLLVPPLITNRLLWSRGYFETIGNRTVEPEEELSQHLFRRHFNGKVYDDEGNEVQAANHDVLIGEYGLESYRTIDDRLSDALGIPRAPE